ncbi:MAG: uroporphyrinogen-III synthase [Alphaproteobacteria bacterium]|nr:uroporphyrinogen-III synthase [Alphaproteobacteria bacterium]
MVAAADPIPVFVTRPEHQAAGLIAAVAARGFQPVGAPCLRLAIEKGPPLTLTDVGGFAVTSANGVLALAARTPERALPLFAVGEATAAAARENGFIHIEVAEGDGAALAKLIGARVAPRSRSILHAAGAETAFDLVAGLARVGVRAESQKLYGMPVVRDLPKAAHDVLDTRRASFVLLMSPRTAQAFGEIVEASRRGDRLGAVTALCMSAAIGAAARAQAFRKVAVSARMTQDSLLDLLEAESARV